MRYLVIAFMFFGSFAFAEKGVNEKYMPVALSCSPLSFMLADKEVIKVTYKKASSPTTCDPDNVLIDLDALLEVAEIKISKENSIKLFNMLRVATPDTKTLRIENQTIDCDGTLEITPDGMKCSTK